MVLLSSSIRAVNITTTSFSLCSKRERSQKLTTVTSFSRCRRKCLLHWFLLTCLCILVQVRPTTSRDLFRFICRYINQKESCEKSLQEKWEALPENVSYCRGEFKGFICWDHAGPNNVSHQSCPEYLNLSNEGNDLKSYRYCDEDGSWFQMPAPDGTMEVFVYPNPCNPLQKFESSKNQSSDADVLKLVNTLTTVYTVGYALSIFCLFVALLILIFFKKLHCTRNYIHMNLMVSFITRYVAVLVKDRILEGVYEDNFLSSELDINRLKMFCDDFGGVSGILISCRLVITLMHYASVTNYFWLLAEGLYLQMILVFTVPDYKLFPIFMAFGWGGPWIPVGIWVVLRLTYENEGCWDRIEKQNVWWAIKGPVVVSIAVNFFIFVNIIRIIVSKLRAKNMTRKDYKYRLARSTLALIPLLGIHYIVFVAVTNDINNNTVRNVKIAFETVFTSIQGMLIAILYCFLNGEVKIEVKKLWNNWRLVHWLPRASSSNRKCSSSHSNGTVQATLVINERYFVEGNHSNEQTTHLTHVGWTESVPSSRNSCGDDLTETLSGSERPLIENDDFQKTNTDLV